ncbi:MAG: hypothetical protein U0271_34390 [Polyangiaceae bacterium]
MPDPTLLKRKTESAPPEGGDGPSLLIVAPIAAIVMVVIGALVLRFSAKNPQGPAASSSASAVALAPPRCKRAVDGAEFVIGEVTAKKATPPSPSAGDPPDLEDEPELDPLMTPYAVILGRAISTEQGFAVGVLADGDGGSVFSVATVDPDAGAGHLVKLERARGDLDPPVLADAGSGRLLAAVLEPNASSRAVKLAVVRGDAVTWGAELDEGRDDSLALDVAAAGGRGLVTWDSIDDRKSFISVASFDLDSPAKVIASRRATPVGVDADQPRLVSRDGGFYLVYLVHGSTMRREDASGSGKPRETAAPTAEPTRAPTAEPSATKKKAKPKKKPAEEKPTSSDSEVDESLGGEAISSVWLEVMPLDATGAQTSDPLRITKDGVTVVAFDVMRAPDGALVVAYRDDDAPTGAGGGPVRVLRVQAGGASSPWESSDPLPADGTPTLLPGWLAVPSLGGADLLARLGPDGIPLESPNPRGEVSLGGGEPIAANNDRVLVAVPEGRAMRLRSLGCDQTVTAPPPAPSADPDDE